jgi:hypothetical protein
MEFEDHYVTCSLKHTMEHWLWCAVLLIEVFGLFWCLMVNSRLALTKRVSYSMGNGWFFFRGLRRLGREANGSPTSSVKVKNGVIRPLPHTYSWHGTYLIRNKDNFILLLLRLVCS